MCGDIAFNHLLCFKLDVGFVYPDTYLEKDLLYSYLILQQTLSSLTLNIALFNYLTILLINQSSIPID